MVNLTTEQLDSFGIRSLSSNEIEFDMELFTRLDIELFHSRGVIPYRLNEEHLDILTDAPCNLSDIAYLSYATGFTITPLYVASETLSTFSEDLFEKGRLLDASTSKITEEVLGSFGSLSHLSTEELEQSSDAEPVVRLSKLIVDEALELQASDIHIEPLEHGAVVRLRVDGMLKKHMDLEPVLYHPLTSRLKIMAGMDIAEKRIPQDGRIRYASDGVQYDLRVSTLPTHLGEKTVIRLLRQDFSFLDIHKTGLSSENRTTLLDIIHKPQGLFLVTGPTGSGKSSTLFAALSEIKNKEINITTIENPVEYKLLGVNQVQINEKAGVTFAGTLRSILRQDPDVILVGETRDKETAEIALQASQTGHLVFSTLHTNDAVAAVTRLRDLGIPGYLIAASLVGVMAQRLVRKSCPHCQTWEEPTAVARLRWERTVGNFPFEAVPVSTGCEKCREIGYDGRLGLFELFSVSDTVRAAIAEEVPEQSLRQLLKDEGFTTMIDHGIALIQEGRTTVDEVLRVVSVSDR